MAVILKKIKAKNKNKRQVQVKVIASCRKLLCVFLGSH